MRIIELGHCVVEFIILLQFSGYYLTKKRTSRLSYWLAIFLVSCVLFGVNSFKIPGINTIISIISGTLLLHYLFQGSLFAKAGLMSFFIVIMVFVSFITGFLLSSLLNKPIEQILQHTSDRIIGIVISRIALILILRIIATLYNCKGKYYKHNRIGVNTSLLLTLPVVSLITVYILLYVEQWIPYTNLNTILLSSICLGLLIVNLIVFNVYDSKMENTELKSQLSLAQKYQNYQDEAYRKQEQSLLEMEHMAHDFKHYLASIEGMVNGSDADLSHYIGTLGKEIDQKFMQPFGFSTNRALNVILYQKQRECEKSGIEFQINIGFGDLSFIDYSDTCAIFGNALDNATTACQEISDSEKEKYIKLNIHKHKDMLLISIENSKNPQQQLIEINDTIRSTKLDEGYHGFGLTNLRTAVLNYEGNVVFSYNDNSFILMVNIMLKNEYFVNKLLDKQENSSILQSQNN